MAGDQRRPVSQQMEIGETWAYRERVSDRACPFVPAQILQFGPPKSRKVRVRWSAGEYAGLDTWVPRGRLIVEWDAGEQWLQDERGYDAAREASLDAVGSVDHRAALTAIYVHPMPDAIRIGYDRSQGTILQLTELERVAADLSLDIGVLHDEPLAFTDREGTYVAPWACAHRIAIRVAERYPELLLKKVADDEQELRDHAVHGRYVELIRGEQTYIPAERCAQHLRAEEPVFALVRSWCGADAVQAFDEIAALRAEVSRLRTLILDAAKRFGDNGIERELRWLHRKLDVR